MGNKTIPAEVQQLISRILAMNKMEQNFLLILLNFVAVCLRIELHELVCCNVHRLMSRCNRALLLQKISGFCCHILLNYSFLKGTKIIPAGVHKCSIPEVKRLHGALSNGRVSL
uniref:Uncharacterized protein n=1 Tax=Arundo donax TaxID=35708 RepID=A0A0A9GAW0_ARUDO